MPQSGSESLVIGMARRGRPYGLPTALQRLSWRDLDSGRQHREALMIRHWFGPLLAPNRQPAAPQQLRQLLKALPTCSGCGDDAAIRRVASGAR